MASFDLQHFQTNRFRTLIYICQDDASMKFLHGPYWRASFFSRHYCHASLSTSALMVCTFDYLLSASKQWLLIRFNKWLFTFVPESQCIAVVVLQSSKEVEGTFLPHIGLSSKAMLSTCKWLSPSSKVAKKGRTD